MQSIQLGGGWLQVARGEISVNGIALTAGDGVAITDEKQLQLATDKGAEILLFDLAE